MITFQEFLQRLTSFWEKQGCIIHQGYDLEVGAGTFNPATFLRCLGPEPYRAAYIEPCRRPSDGRYGTHPNRQQHYFQYQVILKPSPLNMQELYLQSLEALGFNLKEYDIRFVHDDWENPTIGAWGLGWEVWMDGMEITQYTYFQAVGGVELKPVTGEITYGIERLAMYLQKVNSIFDLQWNETHTYGDLYHRNEVEWSHYNFEFASTEMWQRHFEDYEKEAKQLIAKNLPIPAYDFVMKASHAFNILDARGVIAVTERIGYIGRIRDLARQIAESYIAAREKQGFPLLKYSKKEGPIFTHAKDTDLLPKDLLKNDPDKREDFLLEIGSEELPSTFVPIGLHNLEKQVRTLLQKEEISFEKISLYATPRRLALYIHQLAKGKPSQTIEKKGPPLDSVYNADGTLKPAGEGFFRSLNREAPSVEAIRNGETPGIEIRLIKNVPYLIGTLHQEGKATATLLYEQLSALILNLEFPKKMHWSDLEITYARPLHWIVALLGDAVIPFRVGPLEAGRTTCGHRLLSPQEFQIEHPRDYVSGLRSRFVMVDLEEREGAVKHQLDELEKMEKFHILARERVIPQVVNLVEWPFLTYASFNPQFLRIPKEVLISEMVEHQKYFPVADTEKGTLINKFIITANVPPTDQIREGNQRVLSARLSDGVFLYEEDLKFSLEHFNEKLKKVTFQKELGTLYQKVERLIAHAASIQQVLGISSQKKVERAAALCKADLASNMVYEFPDLQGTIGCYYALAHKEEKEIAQAIDEHWMPRGEHAPLPQTETGTIISLADKFDNLLGFFSIDLKPTSSSDPYALRRQVLGIIKILIQGHYHLPLKECLLACAAHFPSTLVKNKEEIVNEIISFMTNRIKTIFLEYHFHKDEIEASIAFGCDDVYDSFCRVKALHEFRKEREKEFSSLYEVYKRAKGQLALGKAGTVMPALLIEPSEKQLYVVLNDLEPAFKEALAKRDYRQVYERIATLQVPLSQLFDQVKILADDPEIRQNRLSLLQKVFNLFSEILDFGKIQI